MTLEPMLQRKTSCPILLTPLLCACGGGGGGGDTPVTPGPGGGGGGNTQFSQAITAPGNDLCVRPGATVTVSGTVQNPPDNYAVNLYADIDGDIGTTGDQIVIAQNVAATSTFSATLDPGTASVTYRLFVRDASNTLADAVEGPGTVEVNQRPTIEITQFGATVLPLGGHFSVSYTDDDPDDVARTRFYLEDRATRNLTPLTDFFDDGNGVNQQRVIEVGLPGVLSAAQRLVAIIDDGKSDPVQTAHPTSLQYLNIADAHAAGGTGNDSWRGIDQVSAYRHVAAGELADSATFTGLPNNQSVTLNSAGGTDILLTSYTGYPVTNMSWVTRDGGPGDDGATDVAYFNQGAMWVTGYYEQNVTWTTTQSSLTTPAQGPRNSFIAYYRNGELQHNAAFNRPAVIPLQCNDWIVSQAITRTDTFADIAVCGEFRGEARFPWGTNPDPTITSQGTAPNRDIFVAHYDNQQRIKWVQAAGGTGDDIAWDITAKREDYQTSDSKIYVVGQYQGTAVFGRSPNTMSLTSSSNLNDAFLACYSDDGEIDWVKRIGGGTNTRAIAYGIAIQEDGTLAVTGTFEGIVKWGEGEVQETEHNSPGGPDGFVARYEADGTLIWAKRYGGSTSADVTRSNGIAVHLDGSVTVNGWFQGTANFGQGLPGFVDLVSAGGQDIFVARYDVDGNLKWAKAHGGTDDQRAWALAPASFGAVVSLGDFNGTATIAPGEPNEETLNSNGSLDLLYLLLNASGEF